MEYGQWKQDYASSLYEYLITEAKKHNKIINIKKILDIFTVLCFN